jgi:Nitroreductase family
MSSAIPPLERVQTIKLARWIYGLADRPPADDPAEAYHEASKIYPSFAARDTQGVRLLEATPELQHSAARAVKRHAQRPAVVLPPPALGQVALDWAVRRRRSGRAFADSALTLGELATVLHTSYGVTHLSRLPDGRHGQPLRAVPSGGALYPLEVYVLAQRVESAATGLYHYDPLRHVLERLRGSARLDAPDLTAYPELLEPAAAVVLVTAMFWRTTYWVNRTS